MTSTGFIELFSKCVVTRLLCYLLTCVPSGIGPDKTHPSFVSIAVRLCAPRTTLPDTRLQYVQVGPECPANKADVVVLI